MRRFDFIGFGQATHGRRQMRALDLRTAAAQIGISASTLSRVEANCPCDLQTAVAIAEWLELPVDAFVRVSNASKEPATS